MAGLGPDPHHAERLPAAGHAWLFDNRSRRARFRTAPAPTRLDEYAGRYRNRRRRATAFAGLCGARARTYHSCREAKDDCVFNLRRARRPALLEAAAGRSLERRIHLRRAYAERAAFAICPAWRGVDRMDRPSGAWGTLAGE